MLKTWQNSKFIFRGIQKPLKLWQCHNGSVVILHLSSAQGLQSSSVVVLHLTPDTWHLAPDKYDGDDDDDDYDDDGDDGDDDDDDD